MNTLQDIISLIKRTFEVSSTDEFNDFIKSLYFNHEMELKQLTSNTYLLNAEGKYTELRTDGRWKAVTVDSNESVFACFNCGTDDCNLKICPKPKNDAVIAKRKAKFEANKTTGKGRGGGGRGRSNTRGGGGGRGRGRGRSGTPSGGRGRGRGSDNYDRTPPKANASHEKTVNGTKYKWCGICKYWMWGHLIYETKEHRNRQEQANLAKSGGGGDDGMKTSDTSSVTQGSDKKSKDSDSGSGFASYATLLRDFP